MKKFLLFFALLFSTAAHAGPMANVEYIHLLIKQQWGIEVPYNPALESVKAAANMKYLLTAVDVTNEILNGEKTTNYGTSEYATMAAADTVASIDAVQRLIRHNKFYITTAPGLSKIDFKMSAMGTFVVDWGDGKVQTFRRLNTTERTYSHTYAEPGEYTITFSGKATKYNTDPEIAAISFTTNDLNSEVFDINPDIAKIAGSLGAIFPTIGKGGLGNQPSFALTFCGCTGLTSIPAGLFTGIYGAPIDEMFIGTFADCSGLTSIPPDLFAGSRGAPAEWTFNSTFQGCTGLPNCVPDGLFASLDATLDYILNTYQPFYGTDINPIYCSEELHIPNIDSEFFVTTTPDTEQFSLNLFAAGTFVIDWGDGKQTFIQNDDIGDNYIGMDYAHKYAKAGAYTIGIGGKATGYQKTFSAFSNGPGGTISFSGINNLWSNPNIVKIEGSLGAIFPTISDGSGVDQQPIFDRTFYGCTRLSEIPDGLFSGISGQPRKDMFYGTFRGCTGLTSIPDGLFSGISGAPASDMFRYTFSGCSRLESIPENLFGDISGGAQYNMFYQMFDGCTNLSGPSARINGVPLYQIWPDATTSQVGGCYKDATGLSDYDDIPSDWR